MTFHSIKGFYVKAFSVSLILLCCYIYCEIPWVDFDVSLGKGHFYFDKPYHRLMYIIRNQRQSSAPINPRVIAKLEKLSRNLYKKHEFLRLHPLQTFTIPLKIHQIWLGPKPLPKQYKRWQKAWQNLGPEWEYKLWTDDDVKSMKLYNQELFDKESNYGAKADILRIEILYNQGGLYVDTDFECLNPDAFKELHYLYDFYAGLHPADFGVLSLVNALIGSRPKHPILKGYMQELKSFAKLCNKKDIVMRTGPGFFTLMFLKYAGKHNDIVFPPSFFYPLGFTYTKRFPSLSFKQIKRDLVRPESLAIHWWEGSWCYQ